MAVVSFVLFFLKIRFCRFKKYSSFVAFMYLRNCNSSSHFAGGSGYFRARAGVCQRVTDSAELLPADPPGQ